MLGHGSVLRLHLSEAAQGGYTCEAAVPGFPKLATSYQVSLRGPPEIEAAAEQKLAEVGASTTVACEVRNQGPASWSRGGVAAASTVTWSRNGRVIRPDNGNFSILDTFDGDIPLEMKQSKFYATNVFLALEHLHKYGVIYRDMKPENILLAPPLSSHGGG